VVGLLTLHSAQQALQNAVEHVSKYVTTLEDKLEAMERKKK
jgi:hypothetical protein